MATMKLTIKRGQKAPDVVKSAGTSISGSDAIEVNIDATNMNKGEAIILLEQVIRQLHEHGFPQ